MILVMISAVFLAVWNLVPRALDPLLSDRGGTLPEVWVSRGVTRYVAVVALLTGIVSSPFAIAIVLALKSPPGDRSWQRQTVRWVGVAISLVLAWCSWTTRWMGCVLACGLRDGSGVAFYHQYRIWPGRHVTPCLELITPAGRSRSYPIARNTRYQGFPDIRTNAEQTIVWFIDAPARESGTAGYGARSIARPATSSVREVLTPPGWMRPQAFHPHDKSAEVETGALRVPRPRTRLGIDVMECRISLVSPPPSMFEASPGNPALRFDCGPSSPIMPLLPLEGAPAPANSTRNHGDQTMPRNWTRIAVLAAAGMIVATASARAGDPTASLKQGNPQLKSAGPLGFGPDGILFVGDTQGAAVFAIDTGDRVARDPEAPDQGRRPGRQGRRAARDRAAAGHDQRPGRQPGLGQRLPVGLARPGARAAPGAPAAGRRRQARRGRRSRTSGSPRPSSPTRRPPAPSSGASRCGTSRSPTWPTSTAASSSPACRTRSSPRGCSPSRTRSADAADGAAIEIYHGAHGRFETKSPVRTFVAYKIGSEPYLLAAYTCTPLVKVPVVRAQGGRPRQGHDHRRAGQPQPPARHDRLPEGRQGLPAAGQQQPRRDEDPDRRRRRRRGHHRAGPGDARASATRRSPTSRA